MGDLEHGWEEVGGVFILSVYVIIAALLKLGFHQICGNPFPVPEDWFRQFKTVMITLLS